jgi:C4-dicarboxylate-specific signal transduction histidine kinase
VENHKKGKILVIDDNQKNLDLAEDILSDEGYNFFLAENGETGLKLAQEHQPDVVLLDIMMPGIDGFEVCRRLKTPGSGLEAIKVIMLTAKDSTDDVAKGLNCGAEDYVPKPYKAVELLARVNTQLRIKLAEDALRNSLSKAEHLSIIGQMATGVANDLSQNIIRITKLFKDIATDAQTFNFPAHECMSKCQNGKNILEMLNTLAKGLIIFARGANSEHEIQSLVPVVKPVLVILSNTIKSKKVKVELEFIEDAFVKCNAGEIQQVVFNLVMNAVQAMENSILKLLTVRTRIQDEQMLLSVVDTGTGILPENQPKIFNDFFTTRKTGEGVGIGLSTVKKIVTAHGGKIDFTTGIDKGTTFRVSLPIESENIH